MLLARWYLSHADLPAAVMRQRTGRSVPRLFCHGGVRAPSSTLGHPILVLCSHRPVFSIPSAALGLAMSPQRYRFIQRLIQKSPLVPSEVHDARQCLRKGSPRDWRSSRYSLSSRPGLREDLSFRLPEAEAEGALG